MKEKTTTPVYNRRSLPSSDDNGIRLPYLILLGLEYRNRSVGASRPLTISSSQRTACSLLDRLESVDTQFCDFAALGFVFRLSPVMSSTRAIGIDRHAA